MCQNGSGRRHWLLLILHPSVWFDLVWFWGQQTDERTDVLTSRLLRSRFLHNSLRLGATQPLGPLLRRGEGLFETPDLAASYAASSSLCRFYLMTHHAWWSPWGHSRTVRLYRGPARPIWPGSSIRSIMILIPPPPISMFTLSLDVRDLVFGVSLARLFALSRSPFETVWSRSS